MPLLWTTLLLLAFWPASCGGATTEQYVCNTPPTCPAPAEIEPCTGNIPALSVDQALAERENLMGKSVAVFGALRHVHGAERDEEIWCLEESCCWGEQMDFLTLSSGSGRDIADTLGLSCADCFCEGYGGVVCCPYPADGRVVMVTGRLENTGLTDVIGIGEVFFFRFEQVRFCIPSPDISRRGEPSPGVERGTE